ncbi:MAG: hypothetical protein CGU29_12505 [Candidatus Dactylopiibacterium carminicum]|uniref:DUF4124 domain-containing protein n=1 Tax=Candidatus Dactylopiibacterium carminicum TaxID=857335 RepID=A0A272ER66_9RHOO|nr:hypothetical protein [Candidatus Dactylopiibacterium carminicum]KAF7598460.1 hypothetical protein BGI27_13190 [Candidatus Dactylopiibacterium carminicum]PAS92210.1 MAG: hypothetical protein CGU29_12505 [Candidatus Dactylopiibacterium carminicum]PAS97779.1 MAG: hypothetical protein BSR46_13210 [Candidatus Dactylopiibacterium carminicum]
MRLLRALPVLLLLNGTASQANTFCCEDNSGRRVCSDALPTICFDRAYRELSPGGRVVWEVEGPLSPEQRTRRNTELRAARERAGAEATARRRDQVLLESYANVSELDRRRDRELANVDGEIRAARARETALREQLATFTKKLPANGNPPKALQENINTLESEINAIQSVIQGKERESRAITERFKADRKRYVELVGPTTSTQPR